MQLTKNFDLKEMTYSYTAVDKKIDNTPNAEQIAALKYLCEEVLQPVRDKLGVSIKVNSGYRSPELNKSIGGASTSQHQKGEAVDITMNDKKDNVKLFNALKDLGKYDQLI